MSSTQSVLDHHMEALSAGDLETVVADYDESSVIIQGDNVIKGLDGIRGMFQAATSSGAFEKLEVKNRVIEGDYAYIVWTVPGMIPFGTDTFVVTDGKIRLQTVALHMG